MLEVKTKCGNFHKASRLRTLFAAVDYSLVETVQNDNLTRGDIVGNRGCLAASTATRST